MKTLIFIFSFLIVSGLALSQNTFFEKYYDFGAADVGYCVQQVADSGYVVCGRQGISLFSSKIIVMKTDKDGILQWNKLYGDGSNDQYAYSIINCNAGGYALVGYRTGVGFVKDIYVLRLNNVGDTIWTKQYGTTAKEEGTCIKETVDSGFVVSTINDDGSTGILKIDSVGNLLWWKTYFLNSGAAFKDLSILSSGGYILSGVVNTGAGLLTQGVLMRTDSVGDSLWVRNYGATGGDEFFQAQETSDNNIIVGGVRTADNISPYNYSIIKTDMNGDTIWTNYVPSPNNEECYSLQQCVDGGYILVGTSYVSGDVNLYLIKVNSLGDAVWTRTYGGTIGDDYGYFVQQTFDGGFVLTGIAGSLDPDGAGVYLIKTDSLGIILAGIDEPSKGDIELSIFPNPTNGIIHLSFDLLSDYKILIVNEIGQIMFSEKSEDTSNEKSIDISSFQSGIYFISIEGQQSYGVKKIVKIN